MEEPSNFKRLLRNPELGGIAAFFEVGSLLPV
jgi:hypothetical protein